MNNIVILKRDSTKMTVSEFFERYNMNKYNLDPAYQRRGDVWDEEKQGFLIDTILKNYPIPPIFLHQKIDEETGNTKYDVIDGKQRLTAIVKFLNGELALPQSFDEGKYGDSRLNGARVTDLEGDLIEYKKQLWRYVISVEYIDTDEEDTVDAIFDRLNRNGEPLEMQELRRAKYHDTCLLNTVEAACEIVDWSKVGKIKENRLQDQEFASELLFYILDNDATDGNANGALDEKYVYWNENLTDELSKKALEDLKRVIKYINDLEIDFDKFKLKGVSHYFALFGFAWTMIQKNIPYVSVKMAINQFYSDLRIPTCTTDDVEEYRHSMTSRTRSRTQKKKRISALVNACCSEKE